LPSGHHTPVGPPLAWRPPRRSEAGRHAAGGHRRLFLQGPDL